VCGTIESKSLSKKEFYLKGVDFDPSYDQFNSKP